jgi:hypothetical protein
MVEGLPFSRHGKRSQVGAQLMQLGVVLFDTATRFADSLTRSMLS